ncbi:MAG TPA: FAD-binding domain [Gemmatimonadaceae bacterium]
MRTIISGVGIAGPMLAYWLQKSGHDVLLVEQAPELRQGGYIIDFWGLGYDLAEKMGILPRIKELGYQVSEVRFVGRTGRKVGGFDVDVFNRVTDGRFTSLRRSDVSAAIYEAMGDRVETIFGDSISGIHEEGNRAHVTFDHAGPREADLVIGADGMRSRVRRLVFGRDSEFEVPLGYYVAAFELDGYQPRDELVYVTYGVPGRQVSRFAMRGGTTLILLVFRDEYMTAGAPTSEAERKALVRSVFGDLDWETPQILAAMERVSEVYFDRVAQIWMDRWSKGRTALVGDAGACVSLLAGEGTGLAMVEAYVLAGELRECGGDYAAAFARYEARLRPLLKRKQVSASKFASSYAPRTALGITVRNLVTRMMSLPVMAEYFIGRSLRDDVVLPDYRF